MFSACQLRFLTAFSGIRFGLLLHSQSINSDFSTWTEKLKHSLKKKGPIYKEVAPIIERGINEDDWLVQEMRLMALSNAILNFTSASEFYLSDLIRLKLSKIPNLLKRALDLKNININKMDIINFDDIEKLRNKYIEQLSYEFCGGELWTKKFMAASKLFDIPQDKNTSLLISVDSIWKERNKFAHSNKMHHLPIEIIGLDGKKIIIEELEDDEGYLDFCVTLLEIMRMCVERCKQWEKSIAKKWNKDFIDLDLLDDFDQINSN